MAFHQPTRQSVQRAVRVPAEDREVPNSQPHTHQQDQHQLDQSQTSWVLFAPATEGTSISEFSEAPSLQTPGRSRLSDLGSLNTAARSDHHAEGSVPATASTADEEAVEDDAELDSLDSHLPSFRSLPLRNSQAQHGQHSTSVFPAHDGLGSFHLDQPTGTEAQDQMYQFERFNPRRIRKRRESLDRVQAEWEDEHFREAEKRQRIEAWRLEHSRVLLDEINRETRRRRRSQGSLKNAPSVVVASEIDRASADAGSDNLTWHDEDADIVAAEPEGFLARFTHKVIKDLLGIDDRLLSILLGEAIPEDEELSSTPRASQLSGHVNEVSTPWQTQMLERVSRELGMLVNQLSEHPGAFSTYTQVQQMPLPYAGLPVIPESSNAAIETGPSAQSERPSGVEFYPTINLNPASRAINIPRRQSEPAVSEDVNMSSAFTKDEWERDLDIKLVFKYIRSRFTSRNSPPPPASNAHLATSSTQDTAAKAARIRQHHPLISRSRTTERRGFKATAVPSSPVALRHHSSCASQSTRRSARRSSCSSRHYWDIGGSLGTGSLIASNGPMGSWGEV